LSKKWGHPVIVENRPGADGIIAVNAVISARDDHTLLSSPSAVLTVNPLLHEKLPYDPVRDIVPISATSNIFVALAVPTSLGVNSLEEFIQWAKANPDKLNWAATPGGSYLAFASFQNATAIPAVHVPYKDTGLAVQDLSEGRIQALVTSLALVMPQVQAGKIKLLAMTSRERATIVPDVPTAIELGHPSLTWDGLVGVFGPHTMPVAVREKISADMRAAADTEITERLGRTGTGLRTSTPAEFAAAVEVQRAEMTAIVRRIGKNSAK
jgi:tripartite-type tricarboxylate transporter receptor subunit TctC